MSCTEALDKLVKYIQAQRGELKVKAHLAKADARDEWHKFEKKWDELLIKVDRLQDEAAEPSQEIEDAAQKLAEELKQGYKRLKKKI